MDYKEFKEKDNEMMQLMHENKMQHKAVLNFLEDEHRKMKREEEDRYKGAVRKEEERYHQMQREVEVRRQELRMELYEETGGETNADRIARQQGFA